MVSSEEVEWFYTKNGAASHRLTSPALQYIRKFIPVFSGIDISPVILIILLMFLRNIIFELFAPGLF